MAEEQTTDNREVRKIGPVETYDILLQRNINGDRLLSERTSIFLAASSILFLAFVMLLNPDLDPVFKYLRVTIPVLGVFLTLLFHCFSRDSLTMLGFYWQKQKQIEAETDEFRYMRERGYAPQIHRAKLIEKAKQGLWGKICYCLVNHASQWWIPLTFVIIWGASLFIAIAN